jgi:hypothetical protein
MKRKTFLSDTFKLKVLEALLHAGKVVEKHLNQQGKVMVDQGRVHLGLGID